MRLRGGGGGLTRSRQARQNDVHLCSELIVPCACEIHLSVCGRLTTFRKQSAEDIIRNSSGLRRVRQKVEFIAGSIVD